MNPKFGQRCQPTTESTKTTPQKAVRTRKIRRFRLRQALASAEYLICALPPATPRAMTQGLPELGLADSGMGRLNRPGSDGGSGYWIPTMSWSVRFVA